MARETGRGETISLRASHKQKAMIDRAEEVLGQSRSESMRQAACREAETVLLDCRYFGLSLEHSSALRPCSISPLQAILNCGILFGSERRGRMSGPIPDISPPEKRTAEHDIFDFDSGEPALDNWPRRHALANEDSGSSRIYVVCAQKRVVGYYALAVGSVAHVGTPRRVKRNMPDPVPVMVLGRLAVDKDVQRRKIGMGLLRDAVLRTIQAAEIAGIRAIVVHAISEAAKRSYQGYGFIPSPIDPMTVMITITEARKMLGEKNQK